MIIVDVRVCRSWITVAAVVAVVSGMALGPSARAQYGDTSTGLTFSSGADGIGSPPTMGLPAADNSQDPSILPEPRSTFADRVLAMTRGRVQLEGGYTFLRDSYAGVSRSEHLVPDMLLRVGLTERFEVRLGWAGYLARSYDREVAGSPDSEVLDPTIGFMYDLFPQQGWLPQTAVSAAIPVTLQGNPLSSSAFQPLCRVLYLWDLTDRLGIGGTTGMGLLRDDGDSFSQFEQTVNIDYLLTDRLDTFLEWEMLTDYGSVEDATQHLLSAGVSWLWTERVQVSWRLGTGLNEYSPDFLTSVRFSVRF